MLIFLTPPVNYEYLNAIQHGESFPEGFQFTLPNPLRESLSMAAIALRNVFLK
jgi:hypothetical protein